MELIDIQNIKTKELNCNGCTNKCTVLRFHFPNGNTSYAGNKCEKVFFNKNSVKVKGYNAFDAKNEMLFRSQTSSQPSSKGKLGIPRVLNMYENFPFWQTLFEECGFEVVLSPESDMKLYQSGVGSVMSDNICFPAKLAHGHILALVEAKVDRIFYPIVPKDDKEFTGANNSFNCPVVSGYPEVIRSAMNPAENYDIPFDKPVINFANEKVLKEQCRTYIKQLIIENGKLKNNFQLSTFNSQFNTAFEKANSIRKSYTKQFIEAQQVILKNSIKTGDLTFIVAGRPYHADPLVNQKVGQILSDLGVNVLTDDVFRYFPKTFSTLERVGEGWSKLNIVSQWSYPNRVIQTALEVAKLPKNIQMIQLNSFGCGPDSFFMEETGEILKNAGKNHTVLRIDEIASPGSIRLRLRSLIESLQANRVGVGVKNFSLSNENNYTGYNSFFQQKDKHKTILIPWFTDFLSPFIPAIAKMAGYHFVNCPKTSKTSADIGLKYGNNEVCYPATLVLGDLIAEIETGKYDLDNLAVAITQTGGQCRATNYLGLIKTGLKNAGYEQIPVIAVAFGDVLQNEQDGFKLPVTKIFNIALNALLFGDALNQMFASTVVREKEQGKSLQLFDLYMNKAVNLIENNKPKLFFELLENAVNDFNSIETEDRQFEKVGLIGEIFVKYNNFGQAHITGWLRERNMEVVVPPMLDFFMQAFINQTTNLQNGIKRPNYLTQKLTPVLYQFLKKRTGKFEKIHKKHRFYEPCESIFDLADYAGEVIDLSNQFGEGWLIAGEVASFARRGINRVVCVQPFGCIANHIVAKGIERRLKEFYPAMNLLYLDIDGGMAEVNLHNRLEFLIA
ncbi:MAG: acyl-CoA dehydratase activase-related protein [Dysgonamonadaceae bacterium]|jgi:predicted nucleotide-binding protein (sugar kinase/HSP70/actin superfamily)|nr:acyl-CoA dehydratase activase-related protein [Dysgonamonadaceae bacterium]